MLRIVEIPFHARENARIGEHTECLDRPHPQQLVPAQDVALFENLQQGLDRVFDPVVGHQRDGRLAAGRNHAVGGDVDDACWHELSLSR